MGLWVRVRLDLFDWRLMPLFAVAFPWVSAVHMVNQLRDYDQDTAIEGRGFVQHLGNACADTTCKLLLPLSLLPFLSGIQMNCSMFTGTLILEGAILHWLLRCPPVIRGEGQLSVEAYRRAFR